MNWETEFRSVYDRALAAYRSGASRPDTLVEEQDRTFLEQIGCRPQEMFDFVEDYVNDGEPDFELALRITRVRHEFFTTVQGRQWLDRAWEDAQFPAKSAEVDGIAWLPRLICKARAKLQGALPDHLMYGCGGDRPFAQRCGFDLAEFLQVVWKAGEDDAAILSFVKERAGRAS